MNILIKRLILAGTTGTLAVASAFLIIPLEGEVKNTQGKHVVYKDMVGVSTACWGQTGKDLTGRVPVLGKTYTQSECEEWFSKEVSTYHTNMKRHVKVELKPYEEIAYTSFVWNVGETGFKNSTLLKKLNSGDSLAACKEILNWNKATFSVRGARTQIRNGEKCTAKPDGNMSCTVKGLTNRRNQEYRTCIGEDKAVNEALHALNLAQKPLETLEIKSEGVDEAEAEKALVEPLNEEQEASKNTHEVTAVQEVPQQVACSFKIFGICFQKRQ